MGKQTGRKSPWRIICLTAAVLGGLELLGSAAAWVLYRLLTNAAVNAAEATALGIIGGADGPTAVFVTYAGPDIWQLILSAAVLVLGIWGWRKQKKC